MDSRGVLIISLPLQPHGVPPIPETPPPEDRSRHRLVLAVRPPPPPGPPWKFWRAGAARVLAFLALVGTTAAAVGVLGVYYAFSEGLPEIPRVAAWAPPILTEVYTDDAGARRRVLQRAPQGRALRAHPQAAGAGVHRLRGRELLRPPRHRRPRHRCARRSRRSCKKATGARQRAGRLDAHPADRQGGPHLRRGLHKATKRSGTAGLKRKVREAILALRLEKALTQGGDPLPLPEQRLPRAPQLRRAGRGRELLPQGRAGPHPRRDGADRRAARRRPAATRRSCNPEAAKNRRALRARADAGRGDDLQGRARRRPTAEEIHVYPVEDVFHEFAPYFVEQVRKDVVERYGNPALLDEGLKIFTTMDSEKQRAAQEAMLDGLLAGGQAPGLPRPGACTLDTPERAQGVHRPEREGAGRREADREQPLLRRRWSPRVDEDGTGATCRSARTRACSRCSACAGRAR